MPNGRWIPWIAAFNTTEIAVAALSLAHSIQSVRDLTDRSPASCAFCCGPCCWPPLALWLELIVFNAITGRSITWPAALRVIVGHLLGFAVMAPVTLALRSGEVRRFITPAVLPEALLMLAGGGGISLLVFFQSSVPLLFLIFPPLMRVAYRGGLLWYGAGCAAGHDGRRHRHRHGSRPHRRPEHAAGKHASPRFSWGDSFIMLQRC